MLWFISLAGGDVGVFCTLALSNPIDSHDSHVVWLDCPWDREWREQDTVALLQLS